MTGPLQNGVLLAARILMAAALLPTGIARAFNVSGFALALAGAGLPAPNAVATLAVVVQVFGPLAVILGVAPRVAGPTLAVFVAVFAAVLHPFWLYGGASAVTERALLLAELGLAGAFLMYAMTGPGAWSWQGLRARGRAPARAKTANAKASNANRPAGKRAPPRARAAA